MVASNIPLAYSSGYPGRLEWCWRAEIKRPDMDPQGQAALVGIQAVPIKI